MMHSKLPTLVAKKATTKSARDGGNGISFDGPRNAVPNNKTPMPTAIC